ncbi:MAG: single-stranded-DNA-specific exonuclease RecJ [Aphanocapsa feldmannii 288cV]|nr:MAG: single-stranded-DNA-specific exonuclease RecJ [Aphanocapsa feldmannii 288cV]
MGLLPDPDLAVATGLPLPLLAMLRRRGFRDGEQIQALLDPPPAPDPTAHFPDLIPARDRLVRACQGGEALAVCGDYDADGMTSTALLVGCLRRLGALVRGAIPSRMDDGYGLNVAMVERLAAAGVSLLVTVDNGVSASAALERAAALGVDVIVTDHHALPPQQPPLLALIHPALTPQGSPYRVLAGVGLAYVLARSLCASLQADEALCASLDLFCIGTVADMAPLSGVNRRWLMDGLRRLHRSPLPGLRALMDCAGLQERPLESTDIAFRIAPRINAVGRLGDPALVVELLTTDQADRALQLADSCEVLNRQRRELCDAITAEAEALLEADGAAQPPFLLLAQNHWHHGVIGIVAARLVERHWRPVALLAGEGNGCFRASVRAPRGFAVDQALQACADLLMRFGGHPAAGGFTVAADRVAALQERLEGLARRWLEDQASSTPRICPDACVRLADLDRAFLVAQRRLGPFGTGMEAPLFWARSCRVRQRRALGGGHLALRLEQGGTTLRAIGWNWGDQPLPPLVDVAFHLELNSWQGEETLQLVLVSWRPCAAEEVMIRRGERRYWCRQGPGNRIDLRNEAGQDLSLSLGPDGAHADLRGIGLADGTADQRRYLDGLARDAAVALGLVA